MAPVTWSAGSLHVQARGGRGLAKPAPAKRALQYQVPPDIAHMHSPEHQQPPAVVPLAGTALVAALLVAWLGALGKLDVNIKALPQGKGRLAAIAFPALIAVALLFAVFFWIKLKLTEALLPVAGLAGLMVVVGHRALSSLAEARLAAESKAAKAE